MSNLILKVQLLSRKPVFKTFRPEPPPINTSGGHCHIPFFNFKTSPHTWHPVNTSDEVQSSRYSVWDRILLASPDDHVITHTGRRIVAELCFEQYLCCLDPHPTLEEVLREGGGAGVFRGDAVAAQPPF